MYPGHTKGNSGRGGGGYNGGLSIGYGGTAAGKTGASAASPFSNSIYDKQREDRAREVRDAYAAATNTAYGLGAFADGTSTTGVMADGIVQRNTSFSSAHKAGGGHSITPHNNSMSSAPIK